MNENSLRDKIFDNYKDDFYCLIKNKKEITKWNNQDFPPLWIIIKNNIENRINTYLDNLENLQLKAKELQLRNGKDAITRIDLFGEITENTSFCIIELKVSTQTEREVFTEILAYRNHFCMQFFGLSDKNILSVIVCPMETRIVRDSYFQDLFMHDNPILALKYNNQDDTGDISFDVYYPDDRYYKQIELDFFSPSKLQMCVISFSSLEGIIDISRESDINQSSQEFLNRIAFEMSIELQKIGIHGIVFGRQMFSKLEMFNPNSICIIYCNPFRNIWSDRDDDKNNDLAFFLEKVDNSFINIFSKTVDKNKVQNAINNNGSNFDFNMNNWSDDAFSNYDEFVISHINKFFNRNFCDNFSKEISLPDYQGFINSHIENMAHFLSANTFGVFRMIFDEYILYIRNNNYCDIFYDDFIPTFNFEIKNSNFFTYQFLQYLFDDKRMDASAI